MPTWSLASLIIRTHHNCAKQAATTYSQAQHRDHRLPRRQAKNTLKSNDLRGRATALGGLPRPSSVLPETQPAHEREPQRGRRRCQPLLPGRRHLSASLATPHVGRSGRAQRDGRASQRAADLRIGWWGALRALTAKEAASPRDCGRSAGKPCRRLVSRDAETRMSAAPRSISLATIAYATLLIRKVPAAAISLQPPPCRRRCRWPSLSGRKSWPRRAAETRAPGDLRAVEGGWRVLVRIRAPAAAGTRMLEVRWAGSAARSITHETWLCFAKGVATCAPPLFIIHPRAALAVAVACSPRLCRSARALAPPTAQ